jgi:hypothetical protein
MADDKATFQIDLKDGTSGAALTAASALRQLDTQLHADMKSLSAMEKAMKNLQRGTSVNIAQYRELKAKIDAKKQSISQAQSAILSLGGSLDRAKPGVSRLQQAINDLKTASGAAGGPLGGLVARAGGLRGLFAGGALAAGVVAVAAALLAVAAAATYAAVALFKFGVASADARRNEHLHLEGLTKLRFWFHTTRGNADEMQASIDRVSGSVAVGRDQVAKYTEQLYRMGLRGAKLDQALEGAAITASVQGEAAASRFMGWAAGANMAGKSVKALTDDAKARLGGILAKQMLSLDVQTKKLHESFAALFAGLKLEPLLNGLKLVTDLFSQSTASGRALKAMLQTAFQPIVNGAESAGLVVKRFFQGMVIAALTAGIALLKVRNWLRGVFGDSEILKGMRAQDLAVKAGMLAFGLFAGALTLAAGAAAALAATLAPIAAAVWFVVGPLLDLAQTFVAVHRSAFALDWRGLGVSVVQGIVSGLKSGASWIATTMKDLGASALKSFKSVLGIASPSRAFMRVGVELPRGVQAGIAAGQPALQRDLAAMVPVETARVPGPAAPDAPSRGPATPAVQVNLGGVALTVQTAATDAKGIAADLEQPLLDVLRRVLTQVGAPA